MKSESLLEMNAQTQIQDLSSVRLPAPRGKVDGYERHLVFDNVMAPAAAGSRERFEAFARSVRDLLAQRWIDTESRYAQANPKRIYYVSVEFLIGRALANNVTNHHYFTDLEDFWSGPWGANAVVGQPARDSDRFFGLRLQAGF